MRSDRPDKLAGSHHARAGKTVPRRDRPRPVMHAVCVGSVVTPAPAGCRRPGGLMLIPLRPGPPPPADADADAARPAGCRTCRGFDGALRICLDWSSGRAGAPARARAGHHRAWVAVLRVGGDDDRTRDDDPGSAEPGPVSRAPGGWLVWLCCRGPTSHRMHAAALLAPSGSGAGSARAHQ